ncbi:cytochrome d ubiquinol oxidase subunit II [Vibrio vulnificus]|nr:cytochrome d ubiquinol oxidase subunit II [Vibrio vulnificus]
MSVAVLFVLAGFWVQFIDGYVIVGELNTLAASNPLAKEVARESGAWMGNFADYPAMCIAPLLGVLMPLLTILATKVEKNGLAFLFSSLTSTGIILTAGFSMFPFVMPSDLEPNHSLTMWDSTSSELTLQIMTGIAAIFVPIILMYTSWAYYKMFGRLDNEFIEKNKNSLY